jgi:hypothetical protein
MIYWRVDMKILATLVLLSILISGCALRMGSFHTTIGNACVDNGKTASMDACECQDR